MKSSCPKNRFLLLFILFGILGCNTLTAQTPISVTYELCAGSSNGLHRLPSGDMYMVGETSSSVTIYSNLLVSKLDPAGAVLWAKEIAIPNTLVVHALASAPTPDGGIAVGSYDIDFNEILFKLDAQGNLVWAYSWMGGTTVGNPVGLVVLPDGAVMMASRGGGSDKARLIKVNANGSLAWQHDYLFQVPATFEGMALTSDGQIAVTGILELAGPLSSFVMKLDSAANKLWSLRVDGLRVSDCVANNHGGLCIIGEALPDIVIANVDSGLATLRSFPAANGATDYWLAPWQADSVLVCHDNDPNGSELIRSDFNGNFNPVSTQLALELPNSGPFVLQNGAQGITVFSDHLLPNFSMATRVQEFQIGASTACVTPGQAPGTNSLTPNTIAVSENVVTIQGFPISLTVSNYNLLGTNYICTSSSNTEPLNAMRWFHASDNMLEVELPGTFSLKVLDLQGKLRAATEGLGSSRVNTNDWANGVYLLSVQAGDAVINRKIAIIR